MSIVDSSKATPTQILIYADGGSRGNPGPAGYGVHILDGTGRTLAELHEYIGIATNNVAEYSALLAGLQWVAQNAPEALVRVRMDSKLVVEQMSGRWKIKHEDMRRLALTANRAFDPSRVTYEWIPREQNKRADELANQAMDNPTEPQPALPLPEQVPPRIEILSEFTFPSWETDLAAPTTLIWVRHGVTDMTLAKQFSGTQGADPDLNDQGRAQARAVAKALVQLVPNSPLKLDQPISKLLASPILRTRQTAEIIWQELRQQYPALPMELDANLVEANFGQWDGATLPQIAQRDPQLLRQWRTVATAQPPGGESHQQLADRVAQAVSTMVASHPGQTLLVVSHSMIIRHAIGQILQLAPLRASALECAPTSISITRYWPRPTAQQPRGYLASVLQVNNISHL